MSNLVIVAIPDENDRVWKVSSEKVPHLTILYLGDADKVSNLEQIVQFVEHAANTTLGRFYLPVDRREAMGADDADTLIFKKGRYDYKAIRDFRVQLLKDNNIRTAYDSAAQFEGPWIPHLTLGYPANPAKEEKDPYSFFDVNFNKIAVWPEEYAGPEFLLRDPWDDMDLMESPAAPSLAMSDTAEAGAEYILEHYGVKGMKWGVRNAEKQSAPLTSKKFFDPEGHDLATDIAKNVVYGTLVPPLAIPSSVRLYRGAYRGAKAKIEDVQDKKFVKAAQSQSTFVAIHNGAHERINKDIDAINKKYTDADLKIPAKKKKYDAEVLTSMQTAYKESANQLGNKRGTQHLDVEFKNDGMDFSIHVREGMQTPTVEKVKHAEIDDNDTVTFSGKIKRGPTGHILGFEFEDFQPNPVLHSDEIGAEFLVFNGLMDPDEFLEHYGVKGMQWGVRKPPPMAVTTSAVSKVPHGAKRKTKIEVDGGENHPAHPDAMEVAEVKAKLKKSGTAALSNNDLQKLNKRLQLETQAAQLTSSRGQKFIQRQLEQTGQQQVQLGLRSAPTVAKKVAKKAGKAAATTAVTVALI